MDISSIRDWHGTPVGIVRVVVEVARYAIKHSDTYDCLYFCFSHDKQKLLIIPRKKVVLILQRMDLGKQKRNLFTRAVGKAKRILRINDLPLLFEPKRMQTGSFLDGRTVISVGFDWDMSNYPLLLNIRKRHSFRFVSFFHDAIYFFHPEWCPDVKFPSLFQEYYRCLVSLSDLVICNSHHTEMEFYEMGKRLGFYNLPQVMHVYPGVSTKEVSQKFIAHTLKDRGLNAPYVLYVSTIEPRKNHILLLKIWNALLCLDCCNVPDLVFIGNMREGNDGLLTYLRLHPVLKGKVKFLSQIPDNQLCAIYNETLFTVFPSFDEGYGLGASESLEYGKICVVSSCPALIEATQGLMPAISVDDFDQWVSVIKDCILQGAFFKTMEHNIKNYRTRNWAMFSQQFFEVVSNDKVC